MAQAYLENQVPCQPRWATLNDALRTAAEEDPDRLYVDLLDTRNESHRLTFADVNALAEDWARALLQHGLGRGARVVILLPTSAEFLAAFYGTLLAGGVPVPLAYPIAPGKAEAYVLGFTEIVRNVAPEIMVTTETYAAEATTLAGADRVLVPAALGGAGRSALPDVGADDLALLQYTSGPVGSPAGVALSHRQIMANVTGMGTALALTREDVALNWIPLVHDMGLIGGLFTSLVYRCPLHVMPPQSFLMHPHRWLHNISKLGVTLSVAPNSAYRLCLRRVRDKHMDGMDLSRWRVAVNGAEMVHHDTVASFRERFGPVGFAPAAMLPVYGLAENTLATACPPLDRPYTTDAQGVVSVGGPLPGQALSIRGDHGVLAEGELGEICVRGPCVMRAYHDNDDASARALQDGWLRTGDLGAIAGGRLYIHGRIKQMVIKMGRNYYPDDIERMLGGGVAFAWPNADSGTDDLVLVRESEPLSSEANKDLGNRLNAELLAGLGIRVDRLVLVPPGTLPPELSTRALREHVRGRFGRGELA